MLLVALRMNEHELEILKRVLIQEDTKSYSISIVKHTHSNLSSGFINQNDMFRKFKDLNSLSFTFLAFNQLEATTESVPKRQEIPPLAPSQRCGPTARWSAGAMRTVKAAGLKQSCYLCKAYVRRMSVYDIYFYEAFKSFKFQELISLAIPYRLKSGSTVEVRKYG